MENVFEVPVKVVTRAVYDMTTGVLLLEESYEYYGFIAFCDRALTSAAKTAIPTAEQAGGQYGAIAQGIQGQLVPQLEKMTVTPPGYGAGDLAAMETAAEGTAAAASGASAERARLDAMRTGNAAGVGSAETGIAGSAARTGGSAIQNILAKNAQLKEQQRMMAQKELGSLTGEDIRGQTEAMRIVPEDINAGAQANRTGWFQNMTNLIAATRGGSPSA